MGGWEQLHVIHGCVERGTRGGQKGLKLLLNIQNDCTKIQAVWSQTEVNTSIFIHMLCFLLRIKVAQIKIFMLILLHTPLPQKKEKRKI